MDLKKVKRRYYQFLTLVIVVAIFGQILSTWLYVILSVGALIAFCVWIHRYWRCPDCAGPLGRMTIGAEVVCPHCGKKHKL